jgi:hypothetical protein
MREYKMRNILRKKKRDPFGELTVSEPISATLADGSVAHGVLWMHASRRGGFEVEFNGRRSSDYRRDYVDDGQIRAWARVILAEMAGGVWPKP